MQSFREAFALSADEVKALAPPGTVKILGKLRRDMQPTLQSNIR